MVMLKHCVFAVSLHKQPPLAPRQGLLLKAPWSVVYHSDHVGRQYQQTVNK